MASSLIALGSNSANIARPTVAIADDNSGQRGVFNAAAKKADGVEERQVQEADSPGDFRDFLGDLLEVPKGIDQARTQIVLILDVALSRTERGPKIFLEVLFEAMKKDEGLHPERIFGGILMASAAYGDDPSIGALQEALNGTDIPVEYYDHMEGNPQDIIAFVARSVARLDDIEPEAIPGAEQTKREETLTAIESALRSLDPPSSEATEPAAKSTKRPGLLARAKGWSWTPDFIKKLL